MPNPGKVTLTTPLAAVPPIKKPKLRSLGLNGFNAVVAATSRKLPDPARVVCITENGTAWPGVTTFEQPAE